MALTIVSNVASLRAQDNLSRTTSSLNQSLQRLSSGLKINSGADGPAALVISEEQQAQITGLQTAISNTSKAVSVVQVGEGALSEINSLLDQARSLALDSANAGVNDSNALAANQTQLANVLNTIDRIAANTQYGTKKLLDGSAGLTGTASNGSVTFLKAADTSPTGTFAVNITQAAQRATVLAGTAQANPLAADETLTINGVSVALKANETQSQVVSTINQYTGQTGVTAEIDSGGATRLYTNQFGSAAQISVQSTVAAGASSSGFGTTTVTAQGTDIAGTIGGFTATGNGNVLTGDATAGAAGISLAVGLASGSVLNSATGALGSVSVVDHSLVFQIGANANQTASIAIDKSSSDALGLNVQGSQFANLASINIQSESGAQDAIKVIDQAISDVSTLRGRLGAFQQQTLTSTANNLQATLENTTAAESVIRDTDFASETANYTKNQVLLQAGTTVLANSNALTQNILTLLPKG